MDYKSPNNRHRPARLGLSKTEQNSDIFQFMAMATSFLAVSFRQRLFFWLALFCLLSSYFNKTRRADGRQNWILAVSLLMAFVTIYVFPARKPPGAQP